MSSMSAPFRKPPISAPTPGEAMWRNGFFYFSAFMGALAMVDLDAGRLAHAMGDAGVACLLLSLMSQFPFLRAVTRQDATPEARERLMAEAERFRAQNPWSDRFSRAGWTLLLSSLALRAVGLA
jgi:hypothetical protein